VRGGVVSGGLGKGVWVDGLDLRRNIGGLPCGFWKNIEGGSK